MKFRDLGTGLTGCANKSTTTPKKKQPKVGKKNH